LINSGYLNKAGFAFDIKLKLLGTFSSLLRPNNAVGVNESEIKLRRGNQYQ